MTRRLARILPEPARGSSLLELLLALALFEVALLAVAALFARAGADVRESASLAQASALAQGRLETADSGSGYFSFTERSWLEIEPGEPDRALWAAETTIRLYPLSAADDGRIEPAEEVAEVDSDEDGVIYLSAVEVRLSRSVGGRETIALERFVWAGE